MISSIEQITETLEDSVLKVNPNANIAKTERVLSIFTGSIILFKGVKNVFSHPAIALTELAVGFYLVKRGVDGYCAMSDKFNKEDYDVDELPQVVGAAL